MMKVFVLYFSVFGILVFKTDVNAQNLKKEVPFLVTQININDVNLLTLKYEGNKLVQTQDRNSRSIYTYNGNFITQIKDFKEDELFRTADFTYDKSGNLETIKVVGKNDNPGEPKTPYKDDYTFSYPNSTTVISTKIRTYNLSEDKNGNEEEDLFSHKQEPEQDVQKNVTTYTLNNGNIIYQNELFYYENALYSDQANKATYDKKNNPYVNILGYDKIRIYLIEAYDELISGNNNIIRSDNFRENIPRTEYGSSKKFTITYNTYGFPVKMISNLYNLQGMSIEKDVFVFTYNQ